MEHPSASHWAKLSALHLARFGDLTKREIQVICALFLCRNGSNNRCNPKRKTIGLITGLPRSHVSTSIAGLESKGWICEQPDGEFFLFDADQIPPVEKPCAKVEKVTESVTQTDNTGVTKSVTSVTESVTESYQIGNSHNKDSEQRSKQKSNRARAPSTKRSKTKSKSTRIPDEFLELTDEQIEWCKTNVPILRVAEAHANFVEYWTNLQTKKAFASNWRLRWEKGMRNLQTWQIRDDRRDGKVIIDPNCDQCNGENGGRIRTPTETYPCPVCRPDDYARRFGRRR